MHTMIERKRPAKWSWLVLLWFVIVSCLFSTNSHGAGKMELSYLYETTGETSIFTPQEFSSKGGPFGNGWLGSGASNMSLFSVPQDNTVGTNDWRDAVTLISFPGKRISFDNYFRNAVGNLRGSGVYIPVISKDVIGFGQVRRFMLFDFKNKIHRKFRVAISLGENINKIAIADARQRLFLFEMERHSGKSPDPWDLSYSLQLADLSGDEPKLIKEIPEDKGVMWSVVGDKNFLWYFDEFKLKVLNMNLEPAQHPLADIIRQNSGKVDFMVIHPHPSLPFAILSGGEHGAMFISWRKGGDNSPLHLIRRSTQFSFSPDGKWVTFRKRIDLETERTYLMPVSEKYPYYLGSPILLLNDYFNDYNVAWSANPTSFVGSRGETIYRWELTNDAHPESDRATFHDYIVERDLEKLAKEKRQGLGNRGVSAVNEEMAEHMGIEKSP